MPRSSGGDHPAGSLGAASSSGRRMLAPVRGLFPELATALLVGLSGALPLLLRGASCGQDFDFHLQSWLAVRAAWHTHHLVPHWVTWANYGGGEPRFVFYPPLSWLLGAALSFIFPWSHVPWAFTTLCIAGAAWTMHRAALELLAPGPRNPGAEYFMETREPQSQAPTAIQHLYTGPRGGAHVAAWAVAGLYALSPYLLFCAYERGALAELLAALWIPPLLAALLARELAVPRIALLIAALWYTNAPSAVTGCYIVLLALAWRTFAARGRAIVRLWFRGITGLAAGCALAADYLLPAWFNERFVAIRRAIGPSMRIRDSFLFEHTGELYHDQVLHTASCIAVITLAAGLLCAGALLLLKRRSGSTPNQRSASAPYSRDAGKPPGPAPSARYPAGFLTAVVVVCALLQLRPSEPLWHLLPQLAFLQFPWRLLLPGTAATALLLALLFDRVPARHARAAVVPATALLGIALIAWAAHTRFQPCDDEDNVAAQLLLPAEDQGGFEGTDEYAAAGADNGEIQQGLPWVRLLNAPDADEGDDSKEANPDWTPHPTGTVSGTITITAWTTDRRALTVAPRDPAYAVMRLERYPAWHVLLNGEPCAAACVLREDGLVTVAVPGGRPSTITAAWMDGWSTWTGRALSLAALLMVAGACRRRPSPPLS